MTEAAAAVADRDRPHAGPSRWLKVVVGIGVASFALWGIGSCVGAMSGGEQEADDLA